jgi:hypothetical protein
VPRQNQETAKNTSTPRITLAALAALFFATVSTPYIYAVEVYKADNSLPLNNPASWVSGIPPGPADIAVFPAPSVATSILLSADFAWDGIATESGAAIWTLASPRTLTLGASGIAADGSIAFHPNLTVALAAPQTWAVATNQTVTVRSPVSNPAAIPLTKTGPGILTFRNDTASALFPQIGAGPIILNEGILELRPNGADSGTAVTAGDGTAPVPLTVTGNAAVNLYRQTPSNTTVRFGSLAIGAATLTVGGDGNGNRLAFTEPSAFTGRPALKPAKALATTWLAFDAPIDDNGFGFDAPGPGILWLNASNAITGPVTLSDSVTAGANGAAPDATGGRSGVILLGDDHALGTAPVSTFGAQFRASRPGVTLTNTITVGGGGLRLGGTNDFALLGVITNIGTMGVGNYSYNSTVTLGDITAANKGITFQGTSNGNIRIAGVISGTAYVNITNAPGRVIYANDQAYTGQTTIYAGQTLQLGDGGTRGSVSRNDRLVNDGTLAINRSDATTQGVHFAWTGTGALSAEGPGPVTLLPSNSPATPLNIASNATLALSGPPGPAAAVYAAGANLPAVITGAGTLLVAPGAALAGSLTAPRIAFAPGAAWQWTPGDTLHLTAGLALDDLPLATPYAFPRNAPPLAIITFDGPYTGPAEIPVPAHPGLVAVPDPAAGRVLLKPRARGTLITVH